MGLKVALYEKKIAHLGTIFNISVIFAIVKSYREKKRFITLPRPANKAGVYLPLIRLGFYRMVMYFGY